METTPRYFSELNLSEELLKEIDQAGFAHPTPIQEKSIPIALTGKDLIGCAQTGTGKTLAFALPFIQKLKGSRGTGALILCPTREIALQTHEVLKQFGNPLRVSNVVLIGGQRLRSQENALKKNPTILVATPGRLVDHMERKNVDLRTVHHLAIDEADHMLDLGFLPQMRRILKVLPTKRQTLMFSATFPREIEQLARQYLDHPERVDVVPPGTPAEGINHVLYLVDPQHKREAIMEILKDTSESTLVFTRTKLDAEWLYRLLKKMGHEVHALHSDRSQGERTHTLADFRKGKFPILVATDVLARGIDVSGIAHVINFDIPQNPEDYIHRVGRTARGQATGDASTFATWMEIRFVEAIEKLLGKPIPRQTISGIPEFKEVVSPKRPPGKIGRRGKRVRLR